MNDDDRMVVKLATSTMLEQADAIVSTLTSLVDIVNSQKACVSELQRATTIKISK